MRDFSTLDRGSLFPMKNNAFVRLHTIEWHRKYAKRGNSHSIIFFLLLLNIVLYSVDNKTDTGDIWITERYNLCANFIVIWVHTYEICAMSPVRQCVCVFVWFSIVLVSTKMSTVHCRTWSLNVSWNLSCIGCCLLHTEFQWREISSRNNYRNTLNWNGSLLPFTELL